MRPAAASSPRYAAAWATIVATVTPRSSSSAATSAVVSLGAPTEKVNAPSIGWESAETTRQLTT
ncbi:hypothetical protein E1212_16475 [Jiangella ureilytica]|uniref:Uncharacterized protein n=1 Tax=Jiangella ureilytica TaxID=2530374 RepID=A0A4R4RKW0_9ACTN|nr:hypothetical protein E1212_16475 [Jiangella ureilytica]